MTIVSSKVIIKWHGSNKDHYIEKGYKFTKIGDEFKVDVKDLLFSSNVSVEFICDYCNGENQKTDESKYKNYCDLIISRKTIEKDCCKNRECINKKTDEATKKRGIKNGSSLLEKFPKIASQWNYNKNDLTPSDYSYGSKKIVWWICDKGHEWDMAIKTRTQKKYPSGCPYCSGRRISLDNCLATVNPEIAAEWHPTKNGTLTPYDIAPSSNQSVWWKCSANSNHEWNTYVCSRTNMHSGCPFCSGKKVCEDNSLLVLEPKLSMEWNYKKNGNLKPSDVTRYSGKKVWWKCTKGHEWKCSVVSRTKGNGCPICSESKGEKQIRKWLENNQIKFEPQKEFDGLLGLGGGNLSYDFYLPNQNLLIEYQGEFHDGSGGKYTSIKIAKQREHDKRKCEYAKQKNIDLLEIWYYDFDNIESILLNNLI
jgi:hypothetical protein